MTQKQIKKLIQEYQEADALLTSRIQDKRYGYDTYDKIYQSYLDPSKWPYSVKLATPRGFTALFNKTTRIIGGKFTGRIDPVEMGDEQGAKIATEHFKYAVERFNQHSDQTVEVKTAILDNNTRLYGAGFLRTYWKREYKTVTEKGKKVKKLIYNNWWIDVLNNRDVLTQPGVESDPEYYIHRRYLSYEELERHQEDGADYDKSALKELKEAKEGSGKDQNYVPIVKMVKNQDFTDKRFEVCTTYYKDKFVTWCPKRGSKGKMEALILRIMENPYRHGQIPIVPLVYIPSQEDIIGMSELQPVSALLKILSALQSQYVELVNKDLYPPTLVQATETRIDTFKYRPKALWLVNNPTAVTVLDTKSAQSANEFASVYKMIVTEFLEAMGETGTGVSQVDVMGAGDKTATEVNDRAFLRGSRDNFNKMMLTSTLKKVMYQLFEMLRDPTFTDKNTVIRVVGKDALEYFDKQGFNSWGINKEGYQLVYDVAMEMAMIPEYQRAADDHKSNMYDLAYQMLAEDGTLDDFAEPNSVVVTADGVRPKLQYNEDEDTGYLTIDPKSDYLGEFNFIPDVEALVAPNPEREYQARSSWYQQAKETEQAGALQREGYELKHKDILTKMAELVRIKDAEQYFDKIEQDETFQARQGGQGVGPGGEAVSGGQPVPGAQPTPEQAVGGGIPQANQAGMGGSVPIR